MLDPVNIVREIPEGERTYARGRAGTAVGFETGVHGRRVRRFGGQAEAGEARLADDPGRTPRLSVAVAGAGRELRFVGSGWRLRIAEVFTGFGEELFGGDHTPPYPPSPPERENLLKKTQATRTISKWESVVTFTFPDGFTNAST